MSCQGSLAPDFCPTADDLLPQYLSLLPRGRAWGEGGSGRLKGGIIAGFIYGLCIRMAAAHQAICALMAEFWCATASVSTPLWMKDYGLPSPCDPFPNLCAKVAAVGGATCAYYQAVAAALGWSVTCAWSASAATITITVSTATSPAFTGGFIGTPWQAGCIQAGQPNICGANISPLDCVLQRIVHAHATIQYVII